MVDNRPLSPLTSFSDLNRDSSNKSFRPSLKFAHGLFSYRPSPYYSYLPSKPLPRNHFSTSRSLFSRSFLFPKPSRIPRPDLSSPRCYRCRVRGHLAKSCLVPVSCYFCGGIGHKRARCFKRGAPRSLPSRSVKLDGVAWMPQDNLWLVPTDLGDSLLLDPDVAKCGDGFLELNSSMSPVLSPQGQIPISRCLRPKLCNFSAGFCSFRKVSDSGKISVAPVSSRICKGAKRRILVGKGKGIGFSPWLMFGLAVLVGSANNSRAVSHSGDGQLNFESIKDPVLSLDHESAINVEESFSSDEDPSPYPQRSPTSTLPFKQVELDLAPICKEDFQVFKILDDFEDHCSEADPAPKPSSIAFETSYVSHEPSRRQPFAQAKCISNETQGFSQASFSCHGSQKPKSQ